MDSLDLVLFCLECIVGGWGQCGYPYEARGPGHKNAIYDLIGGGCGECGGGGG